MTERNNLQSNTAPIPALQGSASSGNFRTWVDPAAKGCK